MGVLMLERLLLAIIMIDDGANEVHQTKDGGAFVLYGTCVLGPSRRIQILHLVIIFTVDNLDLLPLGT